MEHIDITIHIGEKIYKDIALLAYDTYSTHIIGVGNECMKYLHNDAISISSPFENGKLTDSKLAMIMFRIMLERVYKEAGLKHSLRKRNIWICAGYYLEPDDKKILENCFCKLGRCVSFSSDCYPVVYDWLTEDMTRIKDYAEVIIEFGKADPSGFVKNSLKNITSKALEWGIEKDKLLAMCKECLEL